MNCRGAGFGIYYASTPSILVLSIREVNFGAIYARDKTAEGSLALCGKILGQAHDLTLLTDSCIIVNCAKGERLRLKTR